jgi:hypothetical protein
MTNTTLLGGVAWTGTAPGAPGTQSVSGTITSSTDFSIMTTAVNLSLTADEIDYTNFASGGWRLKTSGLKAGTVQLDFNQDYAASQLDALFGLGGTFGFGTTFYLDVKPTSSARSATNPSTVISCVNLDYKPVAGKVGDLAVVSLQFPTTGQVARLTA